LVEMARPRRLAISMPTLGVSQRQPAHKP
jgi:hypothetical protein